MILIRSVFNLITSSPSGRTYCHSEHFPEFSQKSVLLRGTRHHLDFLLPAPLVSSPDKAQWHSCNEDVLSCLTQLRCVQIPAKRLLNVTPARPPNATHIQQKKRWQDMQDRFNIFYLQQRTYSVWVAFEDKNMTSPHQQAPVSKFMRDWVLNTVVSNQPQ